MRDGAYGGEEARKTFKYGCDCDFGHRGVECQAAVERIACNWIFLPSLLERLYREPEFSEQSRRKVLAPSIHSQVFWESLTAVIQERLNCRKEPALANPWVVCRVRVCLVSRSLILTANTQAFWSPCPYFSLFPTGVISPHSPQSPTFEVIGCSGLLKVSLFTPTPEMMGRNRHYFLSITPWTTATKITEEFPTN